MSDLLMVVLPKPAVQLHGQPVSDVLLYQTSDPRFADRALEALQQADISCYCTGTGYAELHPGLNLDLVSGVCIYIRNAQDYRRANDLLVELGAAVEAPV